MNVLDREKKKVDQEVAYLVRVIFPEELTESDPLEELTGLAETAGSIVVGGMTQRRERPDTATYIGSGKVLELVELVKFHAVDVIIFDNDLSPGQVRNLEQALRVKVLDRTELILDIFATHAQTYESRLAVELAQLEYSLPRLKRMWTHLSRIKMGVGMRGPGEKQLEVDRRLVEKRINELRTELKQIEERRQRQVHSRSGRMKVSLVGYTNAGKSTLMNYLTQADVLAEDKLFATLDTRTRRWHLPSWGPVLLSDTVGFIRRLPHNLVASFRATLSETVEADLLLHVADASSPEVFHQISAVYDVLKELEIDEKDTLLVLNKVDAISEADPEQLSRLLNRYPFAVPISAVTGEGIEALTKAVSLALSRSFLDLEVEGDISDGRLIAYLEKHGEVLERRFEETRVYFHVRISAEHAGRIAQPGVVVRDYESQHVLNFRQPDPEWEKIKRRRSGLTTESIAEQ
ncbi:MAG: GTPase HflX [Planctomycetaceae bacterium]|nr:GTPase HflX [Planctomycetaceae bacterium]